MIVTLTPNPSLDRTLQLAQLVRGAVNRAGSAQVDPGGKGVNVSRALGKHGITTVAVLPLGGPDGSVLADLLARKGIKVRRVPVAGNTRTNITVAEPDGTTTKLNEPGPLLSAPEVAALAAAVLDAAVPGCWVVGCGSVPLGVPDDFYAGLIGPLHARGARVAVDSSGAALRAVLDPGPGRPLPDLVKPNLAELSEAAGRPLRTLGEVVGAARELLTRGVGTVLASLGADGAVLVTPEGALYGGARAECLRSTVGAGDALLAGYLSEVAEHPVADPGGDSHPAPDPRALSTALAWGAAAAGLAGSRMPTPADVAAIRVTLHDHLDPGRCLEGEPR
ncbi:MAG TPA: 1-phosphofructokinase [Kineosporiaceae bacterium]|nr:1-phosphofructokinase [Kineosporiaceae bacterium]